MFTYKQLNQQCAGLFQERDRLIALRIKTNETALLIEAMLDEIDNAIEINLSQQECFWPDLNTAITK